MRAPSSPRPSQLLVAPLFAADVYFNDFNGPPGATYPEWTSAGYTNTANQAGTVGTGSGPQAVATVVSSQRPANGFWVNSADRSSSPRGLMTRATSFA